MTKTTEQKTNCCPPSAQTESDFELSQMPVNQSSIELLPDHNMILLDGGWFTMGANDAPHTEDGEAPARQVFVDPFAISTTAVTNKQYNSFVRETGYKTLAEKQGWSFVFQLLANEDALGEQAVAHAPWWRKVYGASWNKPFGGNSSWQDIEDHPAVHLSFRDALAYCYWAGTKLPTEAQWEFAARGGLEQKPYPWGSNRKVNEENMFNVWRGNFPDKPEHGQNSIGTMKANAFEPNAFGLYNMCGNVWEWSQDWFTHLHNPRPVKNPKGPLNGTKLVGKGGSYLCHHSYCMRYRTSSRQALDPLTTAGNVGFRVVQ